ncbi:MAG: pyruvate kinase [Desulfobaccales bacterium]
MSVLKNKRRTKIVCTLGPACAGEVLLKLIKAGMNVARLNFSHGTLEEHEVWIRRVRQAAADLRQPVAILQDLAGPKLRVGEFPAGQVTLQAGQAFALSTSAPSGSETEVRVDFPEIINEIPAGARVRLADGQIELRVKSKTADALHCRVLVGGVLRSHAGVNFPSHSLSIPAFTAKDREDLIFGVKMGVDYIGLSFVRSPQDVLEAREAMRSLGADLPIIVKIERHEALKNVDGILQVADGLMVARGDLGLEVPLERVPVIQKELIAAANRVAKPVITATQMLLSMVSHAQPSRAEATDVANAILDGTDAVMLSEETAAGQFPVEAVKFLDRVSLVTEAHFPYMQWLRERTPRGRQDISEAISHAACEMALDLEAGAILTSTSRGGTARLISRFRPQAPIIAVTPRQETWQRLSLVWGVFPLLTPQIENTDHMLQVVEEEALKAGWLKSGERVVITAGTPIGARGTTNLIKADIIG